jgi:hypothetical protein
MTPNREEMIEDLIKDDIWQTRLAFDSGGFGMLRNWLYYGIRGYDDWSDAEVEKWWGKL